MKLLFVLENYFPFIGGAEVLFKNLCEGLAGQGYRVTVITSLLPGTTACESVNGVDIVRVRVPHKGSRYWFTLLAIPSAVRLAAGCDVVHTTTYNGAFPAWLAARLRRKKCIITVLEVIGDRWTEMAGMGYFNAFLHRLLERMIISLPFDLYAAISRYTAGCLRTAGIKGPKTVVIYPGIDYELFDPGKGDRTGLRTKLGIENEFIYLYFGRPGISKGLEYLVQAVPVISQKIQSGRLLMLLAHEPSKEYKNILKTISLQDIQSRVTVIDPVPRDQLPTYIAAADCVVVPSLSEGFGFSAAEACAMGKPVVASNVASLPEVVCGKYVLVRPKDPEDIANGVEAVYNNMAGSSEKKIFQWSECVKLYEGIYVRLSYSSKPDRR
jgi:D-inositol-3-phosphate glycosyltransferase